MIHSYVRPGVLPLLYSMSMVLIFWLAFVLEEGKMKKFLWYLFAIMLTGFAVYLVTSFWKYLNLLTG